MIAIIMLNWSVGAANFPRSTQEQNQFTMTMFGMVLRT